MFNHPRTLIGQEDFKVNRDQTKNKESVKWFLVTVWMMKWLQWEEKGPYHSQPVDQYKKVTVLQ